LHNNQLYIQFMSEHSFLIMSFTSADLQQNLSGLAQLLQACVQNGASVNFILPYSHKEATAFWLNKVLPALQGGKLLMLVVLQNGRIAGCVQLDYDTPPNQPHRAEVRKLLVHPDFRRQGIARNLMLHLEQQALRLKRTLLTLDTLTGDKAEPLYMSLGYQTLGIIPNYCLSTEGDIMQAATFMYKHLQLV
jgi:ribosomal protein S18 acetylase RimI-like enzyme